MATMNISIPESMRQFIEAQAAEGEYTTSEYIRHLIRLAQEEKTRERRAQIAQYLALCEQQIAEGKSSIWDAKKFRAATEAAYRKRRAKRKNT